MDDVMNRKDRSDVFRKKERQMMACSPKQIHSHRRGNAGNAALHPQCAEFFLRKFALDFFPSRIGYFKRDRAIGYQPIVVLLIQLLEFVQKAIQIDADSRQWSTRHRPGIDADS